MIVSPSATLITFPVSVLERAGDETQRIMERVKKMSLEMFIANCPPMSPPLCN